MLTYNSRFWRKNYLLKHTTRTVNAFVSKLSYKIDVNTLHYTDADTLMLNEIGRAEVQTTKPIMFDHYNKNRETGSFIIIDPDNNFTVGAGLIRGPIRSIEETIHEERNVVGIIDKSINVTLGKSTVSLKEREERNSHKSAVIWFTGLSKAGKSTIAKNLERTLLELRCHTALLDGDNPRTDLYKGLGGFC